MAKNSASGGNKEFELVVPVKILVKPGFDGGGAGAEAASSLRRRSITRDEVSFESHDRDAPCGESGNVFLIGVSDQVTKSRRERQDTVEIEEDVDVKNVAYYMEHCFRLMYFTGMSTYNPDKKDDSGDLTPSGSILEIAQKIVFWAVSLISIAFAAVTLKHRCILFIAERDVPKVVPVGSWFFIIVSEFYYIFFFALGHKRITKTMTTLWKIRSPSIEKVGTKKWKCHNPRKMITVMFLVSIVACLLQPMAGFGVKGWSPKKMILTSSRKLANRLFIWSPDELEDNTTKLEMIFEEYGTKLTPITLLLGISEIAMRFCSNLKMDTTLNMGIVVAILTFLRNRYFAKKVRNVEVKNFNRASDAEELNSPTGLFAEYKNVVKVENKMLNGLMGGLLKIIHAYSIMQGATLFMRCLDNGATLTELGFLVYYLIKVTIMYYFGKKAEAENKVYEQWIVDWAIYSNDPVFLAKVPAILHEITSEPIGLGKGKFLVGQGFIFRFLGFVGSIFMLEVDDDDNDDD